jgi:hypothetical protein
VKDLLLKGAGKSLEKPHWHGGQNEKRKACSHIRELENFIERAVILTRGKALEVPPTIRHMTCH